LRRKGTKRLHAGEPGGSLKYINNTVSRFFTFFCLCKRNIAYSRYALYHSKVRKRQKKCSVGPLASRAEVMVLWVMHFIRGQNKCFMQCGVKTRTRVLKFLLSHKADSSQTEKNRYIVTINFVISKLVLQKWQLRKY
jgi:hypothetical protein